MKILKDFKCDSCNKVQERFLDASVDTVACSCGDVAHRIISMPTISLDGTDDGFPGAYSKWARVREENARIKANRA
jgi:hypothetical protein